jgi:hypothetical protein
MEQWISNMYRILEKDNLGDRKRKWKNPKERGSKERRRAEIVEDRVNDRFL